MSAEFVRAPGQAPQIPAAVRAGAYVTTSGIIARSILQGETPTVAEQAEQATAALLESLAAVGAGPDDVVKVDAFLASADDYAAWNAVFFSIWPEPGPTRTTLVVGFAMPQIRFEIQAVAIVE